jgi:hypothetical protein
MKVAKSPFVDAVYQPSMKAAQSIVPLASDAGIPLAVGVKISSEPADALSYSNSISK